MTLRHCGPSHTDGDLSVHFAEVDVLHTGDTFWNGFYPCIDYSAGGSINGTIRAAEVNLRMKWQRGWALRDTYDAVIGIVKAHCGTYGVGVGVEYAYTMVHGAPATADPSYVPPRVAAPA